MKDLEMFICILIHELRGIIYMYRDDLRELRSQKRQAMFVILQEFINIYVKMRLFFPNLKEERKNLVQLVKLYMQTDANESEILGLIEKRFGKYEDHESVDEMLEEFDQLFLNLFQHCELTFDDYQSVIWEYGDFINLLSMRMQSFFQDKPYEPGRDIRHWMKHRPLSFPLFDNEYKEKMKIKIPHLSEPEEVDF